MINNNEWYTKFWLRRWGSEIRTLFMDTPQMQFNAADSIMSYHFSILTNSFLIKRIIQFQQIMISNLFFWLRFHKENGWKIVKAIKRNTSKVSMLHTMPFKKTRRFLAIYEAKWSCFKEEFSTLRLLPLSWADT